MSIGFFFKGLQCSGYDHDDCYSMYCDSLQLLPVLQSSQTWLQVHIRPVIFYLFFVYPPTEPIEGQGRIWHWHWVKTSLN